MRADVALVELGLAETRSQAQALILAGQVFRGEERVDKAGAAVFADASLRLKETRRYVSRGGLKLESALDELKLSVEGLTCLDVGASTGGFTDCLLQRGAVRVYAVDVGRGLLAHKLVCDERVIVMDQTNARHLTTDSFPERIALAVVDASFIGIGKLLPALFAVLPPGGQALAMVKPQFEVGKAEATKARGVIRDERVRSDAIARVMGEFAEQGFEIVASCDSGLAGPKGNVEHFVLARVPQA